MISTRTPTGLPARPTSAPNMPGGSSSTVPDNSPTERETMRTGSVPYAHSEQIDNYCDWEFVGLLSKYLFENKREVIHEETNSTFFGNHDAVRIRSL